MFDSPGGLFDTSGFMPRWNCGTWSEPLGWVHIAADLGIWSAYITIPCVLLFFISKKRDLPFRGLFWLFGAFILACGTTHLMDAAIFWWPAYRLAALIKLVTALVSWGTVLALIPATPRVLMLRTPAEFDGEIAERRRVEEELRRMHAELERRVADRTSELTQANAALQAEIGVRERFEEALFSAREWFEVTLASIGDAVIVTDTEGRITFLNQIARKLVGTDEEVRGLPLQSIFHVVDEVTGEDIDNPVSRVLETGIVGSLSSRAILVAADGVRRPIDDSVAPIRSPKGETLGAVLVFRDVTERRRADRAMRKSEGRYRALVQATSQIVWTTDPDGRITEDSPSWRAFTGQTYEEWQGTGWLNALHPDDREGAAAAWQSAVAKRSLYETEYRLRSAQGEYCLMEARGVPVLDSERGIVEWIGMNVDVTERHRAAEALRQADRRKDQFLAMLGHELRNPLSGITGAVQVLGMVDSHSAEAWQMREIIDRQARHMTRMIDDLLEVSRISRGKIQVRRELVDLGQLIRDTIEDVRPTLQDSKIELLCDVPKPPCHVVADPTRLAQVLTNLLHNAIKFTNADGRVSATLVCDESSKVAIVKVRDTGIGLSPQMLAHVFEPFSQADSSLDRSRGGLGLGLALVKGLIELHGGEVSAASEGEGRGAEFTIRLQLANEDQPIPQAISAAQGAMVPLRILIIDDQRDASLPMKTLLEMDGHEVEVATTGRQGIETAQVWHPHLVLCDIGLPEGMSGYTVASELRNREQTREAVLVAVTGYGQEEDRRQALQAGFDRHMTKPVGQAELRELLASLESPRQN